MSNFQDLPDEVILKILSYSETKVIIICGQVSKRIRRISHDRSLWVKVCLHKKVVKTELLEMVLSKGCKILVLSNSTILGSLSSGMKSQLQVLYLYQDAWKGPLAYCAKTIVVFEELLSSCCSLQHLVIANLGLTPKMVASICKNGKTLQVLNLNCRLRLLYQSPSYKNPGDFTMPEAYFQSIIQCCQELKEVDLAYIDMPQLTEDDLEFLAKNISPNVVKLNLSQQDVEDDHVKILLGRCNKIKILDLGLTFVTKDLLKTIRKYLNLTLEELSMSQLGYTSFLELKKMSRLKILNVYANKEDTKIIHNWSKHLPQLMIRTIFCNESGKILPNLNLIYEELD